MYPAGMSTPVHPMLTRLRALAARLPGTCETLTWGHPNFRAGKKIFAAFEGYHGEPSICVKQTIPGQSLLLADPRFERAPYVGQHGWVLVHVDQVPWETTAALVELSYRLVAGKRLVAQLDAQAAPVEPRTSKAQPESKPKTKAMTKARAKAKPKPKAKLKSKPKAKAKPKPKPGAAPPGKIRVSARRR
jgi:predicted DNA-binding protein (MmcQ/YjbR family)